MRLRLNIVSPLGELRLLATQLMTTRARGRAQMLASQEAGLETSVSAAFPRKCKIADVSWDGTFKCRRNRSSFRLWIQGGSMDHPHPSPDTFGILLGRYRKGRGLTQQHL